MTKNTTLNTLYVILITLVCVILPQITQAATYYVDATNGNDTYNGLSSSTAWRTIAKVNARAFSAGDSVLFKRGEVWREQLTIPSSGKAGAPITFGAYGTGEKPEINGADVITGWSLYQGNIYVANVNSEITQLFIDGQRQTRARWPNKGWQNIDADSGNNISLYSNSLTQPANYWVGATIVVKTQPFWISVRPVVANTGNTITWNWDVDFGPPKKGYGFYLEGKVEEIDIPGEWCYSAGKVYLMMAGGDNPVTHLIEGSVREHGILISGKQHINIENITVGYTSSKYENTTGDGIKIENSDYINVKDNSILFPGGHGIYAFASPAHSHGHIYIDNNTIRGTRDFGIWILGADYSEITNNELLDINANEISPVWGEGIAANSTNNLVISGNRIDRVGGDGIFINTSNPVQNITISRNVVSNTRLVLGDGGGIYVCGPGTNSLYITHNIVRDVIGNLEGTTWPRPFSEAGIYLDDGLSGPTVAGNIVSNSYFGILLHGTFNTSTVNNTVYNTGIAVYLADWQDPMHDNNIYNNVLISTKADQVTLYEKNYSGLGLAGKYDYNLYYNPYRQDTINRNQQRYTLESWRAFSGQDGHSIAKDPLFVNASNNDFHLQSTSTGIDAGKDVGLTEDLDGITIPQGKAPDIGAYEYISSTPPPVVLYGDVSEDGQISAYDAVLTAQATVGLITLTSGQIQKADVSGNGEVSAYDAALIAQRAVGLISKFPVE